MSCCQPTFEWLNGGSFSAQLLLERSGFASIMVSGQGVMDAFANEAGGHRWQRVPPNERRGRVHTSTVTVAVLCPSKDSVDINVRDVEFTTTKGSGPGGQNRNKVESCVIAKHVPTGIIVRCENERSQHQNKQQALRELSVRVGELQRQTLLSAENADRKQQVGSGMRGDKIRTYREQDDIIADHRSGKKLNLKRWRRGEW